MNWALLIFLVLFFVIAGIMAAFSSDEDKTPGPTPKSNPIKRYNGWPFV